MGERDAAWAAVHDPATDGATLAAIAQRYPEFGEAVLRHPQCYDGLREWLAARPRTATAGAAGPISGATPDAVVGRTPAAANGAAPASSAATRLSRRH